MATFTSIETWFDSKLEDWQKVIKPIEAESQESILYIAASTSHNEQMKRIFEEGKDSTGGQLGNYSTKPISISKSQTPKGEGGYFEGGYKQFKQSIGQNSSFVDLTLFGDLRNDITNSLRFAARNEVVSGTKRIENQIKVEKLEKQYSEFTDLTESEKNIFVDTFRDEVNRIIQ